MTDRIWEMFRKLASDVTGEEVLLEELQHAATSPNTAREDHSALCAQRFAAGWKYDLIEDEAAKTSPLLRSWADLTDTQRDNIKHMRCVARTANAVILALESELASRTP